MSQSSPSFDVAAAHRYFAANCFNGVWELLDKQDRSEEDNMRMLAMAQASLYHWFERADCTPQKLSIGYWLLSRVHATLGNVAAAKSYGELCLRYSESEPPFYLGYAHEALARVANVAGDPATLAIHLELAQRYASQVNDEKDRKMLEDDLKTIE
jgi:hypothetical protein